ncbi:immunodominant staphylococcal antigen IsaB family protein [Macrococcus sp. EM39E]|uniref:immunodominant staphylococcal antigen IsaB family protein n=1 Tax=Macrococcus animalis TaxID=3395467 RepID=UPI0039BE1E55
MNTILKLGIASTLLLGMSPAVADAKTPTQAVTPYYKWNGYSGNSYQFVLDKDFKRALLNSNVTVNGMKATKPKKNFDDNQSFNAYNFYTEFNILNAQYLTKKFDTIGIKEDKKYYVVKMPVQKNKISYNQIKKMYGKYTLGEGQMGDSELNQFYEQSLAIKTKTGQAQFMFNKKEMLTHIYFIGDRNLEMGY